MKKYKVTLIIVTEDDTQSVREYVHDIRDDLACVEGLRLERFQIAKQA